MALLELIQKAKFYQEDLWSRPTTGSYGRADVVIRGDFNLEKLSSFTVRTDARIL